VDAQFTQTKAVTRDLADRFIISDDGNARVRRLDPCTGLLETIAGTGSRAFGGDGGPALDAGLTPSDALVDAKGNLIVCDSDNDRIRIIDTTGVITTLVGTGVGGFSGDGGPATAAQINRPTGIEIDANGNLYIADFDNNAVRRVSGGIITTIAGTGTSGFNGDDIAATTANLANPSDIEIDAIGNVYIADFNNNRVRRVDPSGIITTVAGNGEAGATGDGGPATAARLFQPSDVKLDETGALWVTDSGNQRVRRFTVGGNIETVAGTGSRGYAGDGGPATGAAPAVPGAAPRPLLTAGAGHRSRQLRRACTRHHHHRLHQGGRRLPRLRRPHLHSRRRQGEEGLLRRVQVQDVAPGPRATTASQLHRR
jgi:sugar lactone lactonase YvrE